jgi:hypothetical protein
MEGGGGSPYDIYIYNLWSTFYYILKCRSTFQNYEKFVFIYNAVLFVFVWKRVYISDIRDCYAPYCHFS